jgi:hypothetical protein
MDTKFNHLHNNFWVFVAHERNLNVTDGIVKSRNLDFVEFAPGVIFGLALHNAGKIKINMEDLRARL